jgi:tripartite ATP-independent transporter DctM subunit
MVSLKTFPALFTVVLLLGGIYGGIVTPTEAGALASLYALIISSVVYRALGWRSFMEVVKKTVITTATLTIIIGAAYSFSYIVAIEGIPQAMASTLLGITDNKYILLLIINILFLILGMFIDTTCIILVFIPMVVPMVALLGIDLVHFGVLITINMMIGLATPPFGLLLFVVSGISKTPLREIIREIFPMLIVLIFVLFLITYFDSIVLFLPRLLGFV